MLKGVESSTIYVVCGLWFVVCGLWFVVCGLKKCGEFLELKPPFKARRKNKIVYQIISQQPMEKLC